MYFTVADSEGFVEKAEKMDAALRQESLEAEQYRVRVGSVAGDVRTALEQVSGELSLPSIETEAAGVGMALALHEGSPPVEFEVRLRKAGDVLDTFTDIQSVVGQETGLDYRVKVEAEGFGTSPVHALRDAREPGLCTKFQVRTGKGFETVIRESDRRLFIDDCIFQHDQRQRLCELIAEKLASPGASH